MRACRRLWTPRSPSSSAPPAMPDTEYDPRYLEGIEHFNKCDFFEAHEVWEDLWKDIEGPSRKFFQGLIQAAVALFHFEEGNLSGAMKMYLSARSYLSPFDPECLGFDVATLLADLDVCFEELAQPHESYPGHVRLNPELIPVIRRSGTHGPSSDRPNNSRTSMDA